MPILIMTSDGREKTIKLARDAGANMVIAKPMSPASLYDRLAWIAFNPRQFVDTASYFGPDRRFKIEGYPGGVGRRKGDQAVEIAAEVGPALAQDDIDNLFSSARTGGRLMAKRTKSRSADFFRSRRAFSSWPDAAAAFRATAPSNRPRPRSRRSRSDWTIGSTASCANSPTRSKKPKSSGAKPEYIEQANFHCRQLRDAGGTMGCELISFIADSLCAVLDSIAAGGYNSETIACHVDALSLARQRGISPPASPNRCRS